MGAYERKEENMHTIASNMLHNFLSYNSLLQDNFKYYNVIHGKVLKALFQTTMGLGRKKERDLQLN
jgi:hypothetical protein